MAMNQWVKLAGLAALVGALLLVTLPVTANYQTSRPVETEGRRLLLPPEREYSSHVASCGSPLASFLGEAVRIPAAAQSACQRETQGRALAGLGLGIAGAIALYATRRQRSATATSS